MPTSTQPYRPDLFEYFGTVFTRRMFGSLGLFAGDVMVGIVVDDRLYLKTSEETRKAFVEEGSAPFVYRARKTGDEIAMSYYEVPERLYDEPEEFADWVRRAYAVAEKTPAVRRKRQVLKARPKRKKSTRG
ncbi:MAG: TfoX/Sxy family protein [Rhizomicrobium sp.]